MTRAGSAAHRDLLWAPETATGASPRTDRDTARTLARLALRSLHAELVLYPKPGLVSLRDNGAHADMNAATFLRSLFSLRHYFDSIAMAGMRAATMGELRRLGLLAESRMLRATGGVNTHRGAIFALGMLCAAAGRVWKQGRLPSRGDEYAAGGISTQPSNTVSVFLDDALQAALARHWRRDLLAAPANAAAGSSHGRLMAVRHGVAGARGEAIAGFPSVFGVALPALRHALARGADERSARVHAFFALLACVVDTNVLYRGGAEALRHLQRDAADFIAHGSVFATDWLERAEIIHRRCSRDGISPGGCADLLAAACFVHAWQRASS